MTSTGLNENKELKILEEMIREVDEDKNPRLKLIYSAKAQRNGSDKKIICGGSFNPFHLGHYELIEKSAREVDGSEITAFITLQHSLGKPFSGATIAQRLYMLKMVRERIPFLSVGLINDGFYRNWINKINDFYNGQKISSYVVIGSDLFPKIIGGNEERYYPLLFSADWIVAERNGKRWSDFCIPEAMKIYIGKIKNIELSEKVNSVSSSELKQILKQGDERVKEYMLDEHLDFIKRHGIYI